MPRSGNADAERRKGCSFWLIQRWEAAVASDEVGSRVAAHERRNGSTRGSREGSDAKVCVSALVAERGPECDFADFLRGCPRVFGTIGDGAPPQARIHLNLRRYPSGSPQTKFGLSLVLCNGRSPGTAIKCYTFSELHPTKPGALLT